jgi:hypothetical protein
MSLLKIQLKFLFLLHPHNKIPSQRDFNKMVYIHMGNSSRRITFGVYKALLLLDFPNYHYNDC